MAGARALLIALARVEWREFRSVNALSANNFLLFSLLVFVQQPAAGAFMAVVVGLTLFFPLAGDPMRKLPPERLALLPLTRGERALVRAGSLVLSPVFWISLPVVLLGGARYRLVGWHLLLLALVANGVVLAVSPLLRRVPRLNLARDIPAFPGAVGRLVQKNLREQLRVLDVSVAAVISGLGLAHRILSPEPNPDLLLGLTILAVLALSTYAQQLFAFDQGELTQRYRLLPLANWKILLAKDIAFLLLLGVVLLPLRWAPGLAAGLMALAVGHPSSVDQPRAQVEWRFVAGASLTHAIVQSVCVIGAATATARQSGGFLALAAGVCLLSFAIWQHRLSRNDRGLRI